MSLAVILCAASLAVSALILGVAVIKFRGAADLLRVSDAELLVAQKARLEAEGLRKEAAIEHDEAEVERRVAKEALAEAQRIEDSLVHPRFAVNSTGQFRVLAAREERGEQERYCAEPNRNCKDCYGRGWTGRDHDTGQVKFCKCIKVAG
ncbi:MAG: hypothetical protein ABIL09_14300 [Gemmatimonadota bacterium]